jgi:hypothetical protein
MRFHHCSAAQRPRGRSQRVPAGGDADDLVRDAPLKIVVPDA